VAESKGIGHGTQFSWIGNAASFDSQPFRGFHPGQAGGPSTERPAALRVFPIHWPNSRPQTRRQTGRRLSCPQNEGGRQQLDLMHVGPACDERQREATLNRIALNLLKQDKTCKLGIKGKRLKAGWDNDCLLQLLGNQDAPALPSTVMISGSFNQGPRD